MAVNKKSVLRNIKHTAIGLIIPISILLLWIANTRFEWLKSVFLPPLESIPLSFVDMVKNQGFSQDFILSLVLVVQGYFFGLLIGLSFGIWAGISQSFNRFVGPFINALRQVPSLAWFPLIMLLVGLGNSSKTFIIAFSVFFPVFLNTFQAIRLVPKEYIEVAQVFDYSNFRLLWKVRIPAAMPGIFVGIRYAAGLSWALVVYADMLGGTKGLGYLLMRSQDLLLIDQLFAVILVIGIVGFSIDSVLTLIERRLLSWKREAVKA